MKTLQQFKNHEKIKCYIDEIFIEDAMILHHYLTTYICHNIKNLDDKTTPIEGDYQYSSNTKTHKIKIIQKEEQTYKITNTGKEFKFNVI